VDIGLSSQTSYNRILTACQNGVNVITWSFILLESDSRGNPSIVIHSQDQTSTNWSMIAKLANQLKSDGLPTTHLVSVGGWASPHPDTAFSGQTWYSFWKNWNTGLNTTYGFEFDGVDWDTEGENTVNGAGNYFSIDELNLEGDFSKAAKADGYIITIVPAQSYLDVENTQFSLYLNLSQSWAPTFYYHGANAYAYLLAKYEPYIDAVLLQVYEGWSRAGYDCSFTPIGTYFTNLVHNMTVTGWTVRFSQVPSAGLSDQVIKISPQKLIVALANGWATPQQAPDYTEPKAPLFWPEDIQPSWNPSRYRGFGFWVIDDEGDSVKKYNTSSGTYYNYNLYLAKDLNNYVKARP
jgi:hypothetical protein